MLIEIWVLGIETQPELSKCNLETNEMSVGCKWLQLL